MCPIYGPNEVKTPEEAEQLLEEGVYDFVVMGRQHSADPEWCNKAKSGHSEDIRPLHFLQLVRAPRHCRPGPDPLRGEPAAGPRGGTTLRRLRRGEGTVIVIGAGPAGIQSALTLSQRGFKVELYDKRAELCGSLNLANKAPNKFRMDNLIRWYTPHRGEGPQHHCTSEHQDNHREARRVQGHEPPTPSCSPAAACPWCRAPSPA